ncbi:MAG: bifunctional hydroxymethylpyrimidine kinase/phosphomethylpyrimidine kinase [Desulfovibrionaceae bacterium]|nr:bifunctional hydroxymethylpyrimidine kinase/phosphomethylpyrimidine kinase [Desulfovibrionaceae bacterium]
MERLPCILTIAGSDSGGGAGIQADLKTITMLGAYGASVITALTAQNTRAVTSIHAPSAKFVARQLTTVLDDIVVDAAKTGMLFSAPIIEAIAAVLKEAEFPLVVDPVCVATSGAKLLKDDAVEAMVEHMFPLADLLTPNIPEAELFTGIAIGSREDIFTAARLLLKMGPKAVLIKGGHSDSLAITDWFVTQGTEPIPLMQPRVDTDCTHGTGCTLSAAIATGLGQGMDMGPSILRAQEYLNMALAAGFRLGDGGGPPNHLVPWLKEKARGDVLDQVDDLGRKMVATPGLGVMLPRSRANVAVALPFARRLDEVAGFSGGFVTTARAQVTVVGHPQFGASARAASVLLAADRLLPGTGCAMALSAGRPVRDALESLGVELVWMDRDGKPDYLGDEGGEFEEWGCFNAVRDYGGGRAVGAVGDPGGVGFEPVIYVLGTDTPALMARLRQIADFISSSPDAL